MSRWFDLFGRPLGRRDFMRIGGDVAACVALAALPVSVSGLRLRADPFLSGVASGDPSDDGVVLWTRVAHDPARPVTAVRWEVAEDDQFRKIVRSGTSAAPPELGYSVHAEVGGLRPGRPYWYRFNVGGQVSASGRTRTAPKDNERPDRFRFAFISCQNYEHGHFTAFDHLADEDVDAVIHLGDYIYERRFTSPVLVREHEIPGEIITLDQYRARYATYRGDPALRAAHAACPWIVTTDDHEVQNNYAGDTPERPQADFLLRRAAAYQAYYEAMPLRRSSLPKGPNLQLFRRLAFGRLLDLHVLDTRQYRSDQPCGDGTKPRCPEALASTQTMMGARQERWLEHGLRDSKAQWNVIANQVMIAQVARGTPEAPTYAMDKWDGYVAARERLLRVLGSAPSSNPVVITGDVHTNWVAELKTNFDDPSSRTVAPEFTGTSMSSGGDGSEGDLARVQSLNPHVKFFNGRRGYVTIELTPRVCRANYRSVPYITRPGAPVSTLASFTVESGNPTITRT